MNGYTNFLKSKDQFISRISHELRTPLSSIRIYLELLEHGKPEKRDDYLQTIQHEADRLQQLIEDLLSYTDLYRAMAEAQLMPIALNPIVSSVVQDHLGAGTQRGLAIKFEPQPDLPSVVSEASLIRRVLVHLIHNAINYTLHGTVTVTTRVQRRDDLNWITVDIRDTGPGIAPNEQRS